MILVVNQWQSSVSRNNSLAKIPDYVWKRSIQAGSGSDSLTTDSGLTISFNFIATTLTDFSNGFKFYRAMQAYEKALIGGDTSLILSPDSEFFKFFGNIKGKKTE